VDPLQSKLTWSLSSLPSFLDAGSVPYTTSHTHTHTRTLTTPPPPRPPHHVQREFGFTLEQRAILVDDVRVRASGRHVELPEAGQISQDPGRLRVWVAGRLPPAPKHQVAACLAGAWRPAAPIPLTPIARLSAGPLPAPAATASAYFEAGGRQPTPAYLLPELSPGHAVPGGRQVACAASGRPAVPRPRSLQGRGNARALLHQSQSHMHAPPHTCPSSAHQQAQLTRLLCKLQAQPCS
jgi:hypothetical protein